ncbi:unnamed protein product [Penicillium bialowiezense]
MAAKEVNDASDASDLNEGYEGNVPVRWDGALQGVRLYLAIAGIALPLFLTGIEATIVSTSLVTITDDLQGAGFLIVWASFSNIFGVKSSLLTAVTIFIAFSGGCAGAQTITQL